MNAFAVQRLGPRVPDDWRKLKVGQPMPHSQPNPQDLQKIRDLAAQWGQIVARRAFGDHGPGLDVDLSAMEQVAQAAAAGLAEGTLAVFLERQAQALGDQQPCPSCGRPCTLRRRPRPLRFPGGQLQHSEPMGHCPDCRRDFFPPAASAEA
jgi:hypothetical protein